MCSLANGLVERGYHVVLFVPEAYEDIGRSTGAEVVRYRSEAVAHPDVDPNVVSMSRELTLLAPPAIERALKHSIDLLVFDAFCLWARYTSKTLGLPSISVHTTCPPLLPPASRKLLFIHVPNTEENREYMTRLGFVFAESVRSGRDKIAFDATRLLARSISHLSMQLGSTPRAPWEVLEPREVCQLVLAPSFMCSGPRQEEPAAGVHYVGAVHFNPLTLAAETESHKVNPPRVLVTFGTRNTTGRQHIVHSVLNRLQPLAARFNWTIAAGAEYPELSRLALPPYVRVVEWVEQLREIVGAEVVVCHGGINTLQEAIASGTSIAVLPQTHEQYGNASVLAGLRLGTRLRSATDMAPLRRVLSKSLSGGLTYRERYFRTLLFDAGGLNRALEVIERFTEDPIPSVPIHHGAT